MGYLLLTLALVVNSIANICTKLGSTSFSDFHNNPIRATLTNYPLIIATFLFVVQLFFYVLALSRLPLSTAYPIMVGGGFVIISAFSQLYLHEQLGDAQIIGYVLIFAGVVLVALNMQGVDIVKQ